MNITLNQEQDYNPTTQNAQILEYLKSGKAITYLEALNLFSCLYLPRRIKDLKEKGFNIDDKIISIVKRNGKTAHIKKYFLSKFSHLYKEG